MSGLVRRTRVAAPQACAGPALAAARTVPLAATRTVPLTAALAAALVAPSLARADGLPDPMRPPLPSPRIAATHEAIPALSGIVCVNGRRSAILNGRLVHAGSVLGPFTIDAILEDGVRYRDAHGVRELHLAPPSSIKKPSTPGRGESS